MRFLLLFMFSLLYVAGMAVPVYEQPPSSTGVLYPSSWVDPDGNDSDMWVWDNFTLSAASNIVRVDWVGGYAYGTYGPVRDFTITFYPSIAGGSEPNILAPIVEHNVGYNAAETYRGNYGGVDLYDYRFYLPAAFAAKANVKYWVQIEAHQWIWPDWGLADATGGSGGHFRHIRDDGYHALSGECAFSLSTTDGTNVVTTNVRPAGAANITGGGAYVPGSTVNLLTSPNPGYRFINWSEGKADVWQDPLFAFKANRNRTLVAHLEPWVSTIQAAPTTLKADGIINVLISLSAPAPRGFTVQIVNSRSDLMWCPHSVVFDEDEMFSQFYLQAPRVTADTRIRLTAKGGGASAYVILTIKAPGISTMSLTPPSVIGGTGSTLKITLDSPCASPGYPITLTTSDAAVGLPTGGLVNIPSGMTWWTFILSTNPVPADLLVKITAAGVGTPKSATLKVRAPILKSLGLNPSWMRGGNVSIGTVTLTGPAPVGGVTVALASSNTVIATVPSTITVPAGATSATFSVMTVSVTATETSTISATLNGIVRTRLLTLKP